jgi:hypothetical protein
MKRHANAIFVVSDPHKDGSQQRTVLQIKCAARIKGGKPSNLGFPTGRRSIAKVDISETEPFAKGVDDLHWFFVDNVKSRSPNFVTLNHFFQTALEHVYLELAVAMNGDRLVVNGSRSGHL